jgi:3-(3-hydroxy-phenyl)propionate hydroxylase
MAKFRHGRLLFVGDAAHQVSPFGARGANSGVQDTDNLIWKLQLVVAGQAPASLLDSYDAERSFAADENLLNSTRATDFMTPKSRAAKLLRDAVLSLAEQWPMGRALVNSGRLSVPALLTESPLNTPDGETFEGWMLPGAPLDDAPVRAGGEPGWLLPHTGQGFVLMLFGAPDPAYQGAIDALANGPVPVRALVVMPAGEPGPAGLTWLEDAEGLVAKRFDARSGTAYLVRPDQHVAARWRRFDAAAVRAALARATGQESQA